MEQSTNKKDNLMKIQNLPIIHPTDAKKKYSEKEEKHLREMNSYEFMNLEEPGLMITFSYGNAGNKHIFKLMHGAKYTLPRFMQRHVESKSTPIWGWQPDGTGRLTKILKGKNSRFQLREVYD
tara:strand:- start:8427 stop:8795 length:369 start_codon:yes stop_codon:yes gene_type:complete